MTLARTALCAAFMCLTLAFPSSADAGDGAAVTLTRTFVGYPDGAGGRWVHGKNGQGQPTIELHFEANGFEPAEVEDGGWKISYRTPILLFSSPNPETINRHVKWREVYDPDGVALRCLGSALWDPLVKQSLRGMPENVRTAAVGHERVSYLTYDLSGKLKKSIDYGAIYTQTDPNFKS